MLNMSTAVRIQLPTALSFFTSTFKGKHLALDVSTFARNERTLLLQLVSRLCQNEDGIQNKALYKLFFDEVHFMIESSEKWKSIT